MLKGAVIGIFCFGLFLGNIFIFHIFKIKRRFFAMVKLYFLVAFIYIGLFIVFPEEWAEKFIASLIPLEFFAFLNGVFLQFSFFYLCLYIVQLADRSPSTRIMTEIGNSPKKRLTLEQLKDVYRIEEKIFQELEDMLFLSYLKNESGFYLLTEKGKIHMKVFKFIRDYLKLRRS